MPRPRRWRAYRITSFYIPLVYENTMRLFEDLAKMEDKSVSELILSAVSEYVELHYPGNPQLSLKSFQESGLKPIRLEAKFLATKISNGLKTIGKIKENRGKHYLPGKPHMDLIKNVIRLARLNRKIKSEEYDDLVDRGERELE